MVPLGKNEVAIVVEMKKIESAVYELNSQGYVVIRSEPIPDEKIRLIAYKSLTGKSK